MGLPTIGSKQYLYAGAKKGTAWGMAVAMDAASKLAVENDGNPEFKQPYVVLNLLGMYAPTGGRLGQLGPIEYSPETEALCYNHGVLTSIIAAIFGTAGNPSGDANNAYTHTFVWADAVSAFFTYCTLRPGHLWEIPSAMPYKLTIKVKAGVVSCAVAMRGQDMTDNGTNNNTTMESMAYPTVLREIRLDDCVVLLAAQEGAAFNNTTDEMKVSDMEFVLERTIDSKFCSGSDGIALPREQDPKWTGKLTKLRLESGDHDITEYKALTPYRLRVVSTGPVAVGAIHYSWEIGFPRIVLTKVPDKKLAEIMDAAYEFVGEPSANNAENGMNNQTRPYIKVTNLYATDYLA